MTLFNIRCVWRLLITQPHKFYVINVKVVKTEFSNFSIVIIAQNKVKFV